MNGFCFVLLKIKKRHGTYTDAGRWRLLFSTTLSCSNNSYPPQYRHIICYFESGVPLEKNQHENIHIQRPVTTEQRKQLGGQNK